MPEYHTSSFKITSFICLGKQKTKFLDRLKTQQEALQALKEAFDDLHQKHAELSLQAKSHEQHIHEMEVCIQKHMSGITRAM